MPKSKLLIISLASLVFFVGSFSPARAGNVLFETTLRWYYSWVESYWGSGSETRVNQVSIRYKPTAHQEVCTIKPGLYKSGNPTDGIVMTVREGGNGYPPGSTMIGTTTVPSSQIAKPPLDGNVSTYTSFSFSPCLKLTAGTTYFFGLSRTRLPDSNTPDLSNWYVLQMSNLIVYPQTAVWRFVPVNGFWGESIGYEPALRLEGSDTKEPVVIVPGIFGSRLNRASDGEEVWPAIGKMTSILDLSDSYLNELKLDNDGNEILDMNSPEVIEKVLFFNQYGNLIKKFKDSGYVVGRDLFVVPYDWRLDITKSSRDLDVALSQAITNSPTGKVNIIAHSMGGLLVKDYLMRNGDAKVNKLIFAGTPHLGAPKAFNALNYGDDFDFKFVGLGLNKNKAKEISQNMPSVYALLPSREYLTKTGSYVKDDSGTNLNYDETNELMTSSQLLADHRNSSLLTQADQFHQAQDTWLPQSARVYNLLGCRDYDTIGSYSIDADGSVDIDSITGDGTVPLISAEHVAGQNYFVSYPQTKINHSGLISDTRTIGLLYTLVASGSTSVLPTGISKSSTDCDDGMNAIKRLRFSTHSPVNLHVYDSLGNHTGLNVEGIIETNIPDSSFTQVGDNTFIFVSDTAQYSIKIDAYATGSFDFKVKTLTNGHIEASALYDNIPIENAHLKADFNFTEMNSLSVLNVDQQGDGEIDIGYSLDGQTIYYHDREPPVITLNGENPQIIEVHNDYVELGAVVVDNSDANLIATIDASNVNTNRVDSYRVRYDAVDSSGNQANQVERNVEVVDTTKPEINFMSPVSGEYPRSATIPITFTATDNYKLMDVTVHLDGQVFEFSSIDLFFVPLGAHSLVITARDEAGNTTTKQVDFNSTATIQSTVSDLERIYSLGWTNGTVKNSLKTLLSPAFINSSQGNKKIALLGTAFLKQLEKEYNKGSINKQAYDLISEDILWILSH